MGKKVYIYRGPHFALFLNPICQLVRADINGQIILASHLNNVNRHNLDALHRHREGIEAYPERRPLPPPPGGLH
ncbi:protein SAR DEFICIENT 1-like [Senna tora]|uniref:Protein SAR DEFICIENT 1-like n=1 Tax=Senna tora TaxID=362788 RepID=A0A834WYC5_9FABA|nr:protein SAR DEFICIENT 1-like [Senna tora]